MSVLDGEKRLLSWPHRRYDPLMGEWLVVSPHRITRPWAGQLEVTNNADSKPSEQGEHSNGIAAAPSVTANPLGPGATRSGGIKNPMYENTYMFANDFAALNTSQESIQDDELAAKAVSTDSLYAFAPSHGDCQVMCFHPSSDKTLPLMQPSDVRCVIDEFCTITERYQTQGRYEWLQIFENHGTAVGCSNPHPHCQIWACGFLPSLVKRRDENQRRYHTTHGVPLLLDYARREETTFSQPNHRLVVASTDWLVVVPWWACWPYETMIIPRKRHIRWLHELTNAERDGLVDVTRELLTRYDNLFHTDFPYTMGWYQAPLLMDDNQPTSIDKTEDYAYWQLHAIYQPPLLRSATQRKFMSGFEVLDEPQRDLLPETAADLLRKCSTIHYTAKLS